MSLFNRREILRSLAAAGSTLPLTRLLSAASDPVVGTSRRDEAYRVRVAAAALQRDSATTTSPVGNGDEPEVPRFAACYSKGLPHNGQGEVNGEAYELLLRALRSGDPRDFDFIPHIGEVKLANPQAAFAFNLVGPDSACAGCPPAPRFASAEQAAEMAELYWQAILRDLPFSHYDGHELASRAANELTRLYGWPVTPATLFRCRNAGSAAGPYISQFLCKEIFYAPLPVTQKLRSAPAGHDYLDDYDRWLDLQNGLPPGRFTLDDTPCFIRGGRDLAEYVHRDFSFQAPLSAGLILFNLRAPLNPGNPYATSSGQAGFVTFGAPHLLYLIAIATQSALTACWHQKWLVHRRLRPEEMGGRVETQLRKRANYPIHRTILDSDALALTTKRNASALLTSSYPEGAPTHPSYPAGHAVIAGAGITILKAFFDETFVIPDPVVPSADGRMLVPYDGPPLTVGAELDKLASNIGMGRNFAGIHWRSDLEAGMRLGEEVAISVLREARLAARESSSGFRFHRIDGQPVMA
jgi:hypothetical protein